jgi:hypothetical protein
MTKPRFVFTLTNYKPTECLPTRCLQSRGVNPVAVRDHLASPGAGYSGVTCAQALPEAATTQGDSGARLGPRFSRG